MKTGILSIDQSTTSTKVYLMDTHGNIMDEVAHKHQQFYPQSGWVEHDAMEIYHNMRKGIETMLSRWDGEVLGIGISNQRETTVVWDRETGQPLYHAIVWQCRRTMDQCIALKEYEPLVEKKTGLKIDPYFSATKIKWLLDHIDVPYHRVCAGTMDSWLLYQLTGRHLCDHTNASRTLLYDLDQRDWDEELLEIFQIPRCILPTIVESDGDFGTVELLGRTLPILSVIGDSQSALYAHGAYHKGDVKITMGTGSSVMMNMGAERKPQTNGVVTALAYRTRKDTAYAGEAIINSSADTLNWLRDDLGLYDQDAILNDLKMDAHGVYLVPAFVGLGIPYWMSNAKACVSGISRNTSKQDLIVAGLSSIAYQIYDAITALEEHAGSEAVRISADGGASRNPILMQFLSDISQKEIMTFEQSAFSAYGVYLLAMQRLGIPCENVQKIQRIYHPMMKDDQRKQLLDGWRRAIEMVVYDAKRR